MEDELLELGERIARLLVDRHETIAVAESSAGGLISAALLSVGGASAYFVGGGVVYTRTSRNAMLAIPESSLEGVRASTEAYALMLARAIRERLGTTWAIGETGATGPTGNRYGDAPGHVCLAVSGPSEASRTLETGTADRHENMSVFAAGALRLCHEVIGAVH
ncbi:MAG: CinA family protein [Chloroflexi bacterium]|nr:CinA family protein [Chloroflexota bacterium]MBV9601595.1 CinA family protein [Chloroflexota bacterium]